MTYCRQLSMAEVHVGRDANFGGRSNHEYLSGQSLRKKPFAKSQNVRQSHESLPVSSSDGRSQLPSDRRLSPVKRD